MGSRKSRAGIPAKLDESAVAVSTLAEAAPAVQPASPAPGFPVVGIGASAGGLGAFEAFLGGMPADTAAGMAFILVQHLAPDHKSLLTELVQRCTRMQVFEVGEGTLVKPDCVYIIPPNRDMALLNGELHLTEQASPRGHQLPIDHFFRSLAQDLGELAIGIVLSGTGSDGTLGIRAIKGEGGMAMAQAPESTEYGGMPQSVIATGLVDFILRPEQMAAQLLAYTAQTRGHGPRTAALPAARPDPALKGIFALLRNQTGHDFSQYKPSTIQRRVERRMAVQQVARIEDYLRFLGQEPKEVEALFRDLLIGVTRFFRDPEAFAALQEQVIPTLFTGKAPGDLVRVWVPACSTGEEAYSLGILLQEHLETLKDEFRIQVFATDLDRQAILHGRAGVYPANIAADVTAERLGRFFTQEPDQGGYRVTKAIRDLLIFSEQDVVRDPPFSRLDLVSCRNLLIYLGGELQKKLIPLFHYALNPGGALFLGSSETVGGFLELFTPLDRKWKIYQQNQEARGALRLAFRSSVPVPQGPAEGKVQLQDLVERELLESYAPAAVAINPQGDILYVHGRTGHFLEPAQGAITMNVLPMAREGLRPHLGTALRRLVAHRAPVRFDGLRVRTNGRFSTVNLSLRPLGADAAEGLVLVIFEEPNGPDAETVPPPVDGAPADTSASGLAIAALKQELRAKDESLQSTLEEMQTSNEELKSINEEMQSGNEELQSSNEEMETSREELQSVNEELATVNAELQQRLEEVTRSNNDMNNLLAGTGVATLFLDNELRIRRFTPSVTQLINLIPGDVGRPLNHISSNLVGYKRLVEDAQEVLASTLPRETEVQVQGGAWYLLRLRPYRTQEGATEGVVIIFVEVTEQRRMRDALKDAQNLNRLAVVVRDASDAITVQDLTGRILTWNPGAERIYGWEEAEALAMNARDLVPADLRDQTLAIAKHLSLGEVLAPQRTRRMARDGRTFEVWLTATALADPAGKVYAIATTERKVPEGPDLGG
jgi:two-component system CheB/CheR fusion protein